MLFCLVNSNYDRHTERGYVEFRANDDGEIVIAMLSPRADPLPDFASASLIRLVAWV